MFEVIFSRPRPWLFGHLMLPAGSKSLGSPSYSLASGSQAPLVGVLVQVTRAVRLRDGKFLILATAVARFKVGSSRSSKGSRLSSRWASIERERTASGSATSMTLYI
jgi:Lon protease-like protein